MNLDDFELFFVDAEEEKCYIENDDDLQAAYLYSRTFSTAMLSIQTWTYRWRVIG